MKVFDWDYYKLFQSVSYLEGGLQKSKVRWYVKTKKQINRHIDMMLNRLSIQSRTVFDLAINEKFGLDEIAHIKRIPLEDVEQYLAIAKKNIQLTIKKRYL